MELKNKTSRRSFIKNSALVFAGISIIPRHVLGKGFIPPSDKLNVAVIGGGGKGYTDAIHTWNNGASNIAAICDVDWNRASKAFEIFPKAKRFKDFRKVLDEIKDIDVELEINYDSTVSNPLFFDEYQKKKENINLLMEIWEDIQLEIEEIKM